MSEQDPHIGADGAEEQTLYRTTGPMMTRRNVLRAGAAAGAATAMPVGASQLGYSPVGRAQAALPLAGIAIAAAVGMTAGAWIASKKMEGGETETLTQTHRNLRSVARSLDSSADEEEEFENLVAERSHNWIWEDAVLEFVRGFNDTSSSAPSIPELKSEMENNIRDDYADLEQVIVDNQTTDVLQLIEMWNHVHSYGHADHAGDLFGMYHRYQTGVDSTGFGWVGGYLDEGEEEAGAEYGVEWEDDVLRPFSDFYGDDPIIETDDIIYHDYELVNGETMEAAIGWGMASFYDGGRFGSWRLYDRENGNITDVTLSTRVHSSANGLPHYFGVSDPDDPDNDNSYYEFLHLNRRESGISAIREAATNLAAEVDSWVDMIDQEYARGTLPVADVVSAPRLWEEYSYEEGNPSITALAATKLGFETDLKGTATIVEYADATTEDDIEGMDGETFDGYLLLHTADEVSVKSGETYVIDDLTGEDGSVLMTRPSGNTVELEGVIEVVELRSYEDGKAVEVDSMTPESYTFSPRDPNRYEEDVDDANNAREDATKNPDMGNGGGLGFGGSGSRLALLGAAVAAGVAALLGLGKDDQRGRRY